MIKPAVEKMDIKFDQWFSEKTLIDSGEVEEALNKFKENGLTKEEDGALWFKTTEFGDDKDRVLVKSDGEKTYFANDTAYHWDKFAKRKFDKVVNFWGADHQGYVSRLQAAVTAMGFGGKLDIVIMQLVRLIKDNKEFKMSKRKGTYVTMDDLLELIGGSTKEASDVARFFFLMRSFSTHMDFDLDLASEHSEKNPVFYVKYAFARLSGILNNAKKLKLPEADLARLVEPEEIELIDQLSQLQSVVASILMFDEYPVHYLPFYAIETARKFHTFYDKCRVIDEDNLELTAARLKLVEAARIVLKIVMEDLIGIEAPERM
jgi:arginyl-tRNA synthetase